jgi:NAD+ kinase
MYGSIAITTKRNVEDKEFLKTLIHFLIKKRKKVFLSRHARDNLHGDFSDLPSVDYNNKFDLLLSIGGDGSILRAARNLKHISTPILGINAGHLGFLANITMNNWEEKLEKILSGKGLKVHKTLCRVQHIRNGKTLIDSKILNEIVISYSDMARVVSIDAKIDKRKLCTYNADGLIVSTPTGSTAYNLAAGGPIVYPTLSAIIITPICSHSLTQKPIVLPGDKKVTLEFKRNSNPLNLTLDGQRSFTVEKDDIIKVEVMKRPLNFIKLPGQHFVKTLRQKLHWGESPI